MTTRLAIAAIVLLALAVPAFWPAYLSRPSSADGYTHAHALIGTLWLLLLIAQPLLVRARRLAAHRLIGRAGLALGAAFVVSSVLLTHQRASRMGADAFARDGFGFYLPLMMAALFGAALVLAIRWRRPMAVHARFMACTALALVDPLISRLLYTWGPPLPHPMLSQVPAFIVMTVVLAGMLRTLPAAAPGRREFGAFAATVIIALLFHFATPHVAPWLWWMQWFRGLPLT